MYRLLDSPHAIPVVFVETHVRDVWLSIDLKISTLKEKFNAKPILRVWHKI